MTPDYTFPDLFAAIDAHPPRACGHAHSRRTDPETSHAAARSVSRVREARERILRALKTHGPMTDGEIFPHVHNFMSPSGARSRRNELVDEGLVEDSGKRGLTESGRATIVWRVVA